MASSRPASKRSGAKPKAVTAKHDTLPPRIGAVLHGIRQAQRLSLDKVAASSGVSKSMLSQIERDLTNPTFATLWRLANALGVTIEDLIRGTNRERGIEIVAPHSVPSLSSADSKCLVRILSPMELTGQYEWYEMRFAPHGELVSEPHEPGTIEHLTVAEGRLSVESAGYHQELARGATAQYRADQPHAIRNITARNARAFVVVTFWPRKTAGHG
jgi:transcriptional regulator with XRE-family HTH domain